MRFGLAAARQVHVADPAASITVAPAAGLSSKSLIKSLINHPEWRDEASPRVLVATRDRIRRVVTNAATR